MSLNQALKIKFVLVSVSVAHELEFSPETTIGTVKAEIIKNFAIGSGIVKIRGPNGMHCKPHGELNECMNIEAEITYPRCHKSPFNLHSFV